MIKKIILSSFILTIGLMVYDSITNFTLSSSGGAKVGYCGDPAGGNKTCVSCHSGSSVVTKTGWITSNIGASGYTPNNTYTITATATYTGRSTFGFEVSPQQSNGTYRGTLIVTNSTQTQLKTSTNGVGYITHTLNGTSGANSKTWSFNWKAPAAGSGPVTFYGAFNAADNSGNNNGDLIFKSTLVEQENTTTGIDNIIFLDNAILIYPNPTSNVLNVKYQVNQTTDVKIKLFDIHGKEISNLFSENKTQGNYTNSFNLESINTSGVYLVSVNAGEKSFLQKIIIEK